MDLLKDFLPELGLSTVHDDRRDETGIDHFKKVRVLEQLWCCYHLDRLLPLLLQHAIKTAKTVVVAAGASDMHFPA